MKFVLTNVRCFLFFLALFFTSVINAQTFNIEPDIVDTLSENEFRYSIKGIGLFDTTMVMHVALYNPSDPNEILHRDSVSFASGLEVTYPNFNFDTEQLLFNYFLGTFSSPTLQLHVWLSRGDELLNEVYFDEI